MEISPVVETSVGIVRKQSFSLENYTTVGGREIRDVNVGWESYGTLNAEKSNVVLVPHYFTGNSHAAGKYREDDALPGYWDRIIGPGKAINTDKYFVIGVDSLTNLNTKDGVTITTGPFSIDPASGKPYGMNFPVVTLPDFVRLQKSLLDQLGITRLHAVIGCSMGAQQAYEWAAAYPDMVDRIVPISGVPSQKAYALVMIDRWAAPVKLDRHWNEGNYYGGPEPVAGTALGYYNLLIDSLHPELIATLFSHRAADPCLPPLDSVGHQFQSENALKVQAALGAARADPNHLLYMAKACQLFVAGTPGCSVDPSLKNIRAKTLVIQVRTDLIFPSVDARAVVAKLRENGTDAEFHEMNSSGGHLAIVTDIHMESDLIRSFLDH